MGSSGPLPPRQVIEIGVAVADALTTAHAAGILHRDVKPGNILLDAYGTPKLGDFGLAAVLDASGDATATREALTPAYASPEAFAMVSPTPGRDVYGLAASLYALLAGRPPRSSSWPPASLGELEAALRAPVLPVPGVPRQLHAVLERALEPDPADRTGSAAEFRDALWQALLAPWDDSPPAAAPSSSPVVAGPPPSPKPWSAPSLYQRSASALEPLHLSAPATASTGTQWSRAAAPSVLGEDSVATACPPRPRVDAPSRSGHTGGSGAVTLPPGQPPPPRQRHQRSGRGGRRPGAPMRSVVRGVLLVLAVGCIVLVVNRVVEGPGTVGATARAPASSPTISGARPPKAPVGFSACSKVQGGFCPATPQCWGGLVIVAGVQATARPKPCDEPHYWETYAGGWLPADAEGLPLDLMSRRSEIARVCTTTILRTAARPRKDVRRWERELLPVQLPGSGRWVFHCVAAPAGGGEVTGTAFRP